MSASIAPVTDDPRQLVAHSASLFQEFGALPKEDLPPFEADSRPASELLEEIEYGLFEQTSCAACIPQ